MANKAKYIVTDEQLKKVERSIEKEGKKVVKINDKLLQDLEKISTEKNDINNNE